ncbi:MAG: hypothetical protein KKA60_13330 [Proteobacteria bacterium]|nr:hypothetical protein [Pseudomonadota bacterium]
MKNFVEQNIFNDFELLPGNLGVWRSCSLFFIGILTLAKFFMNNPGWDEGALGPVISGEWGLGG